MDNLEKMVKNSIKIAKSIFLGKTVNKGERGKRRGEGGGQGKFLDSGATPPVLPPLGKNAAAWCCL